MHTDSKSGQHSQSGDRQRKGSILHSTMNKSGQAKEHVQMTSNIQIHPPVVLFADITPEIKDFAFEKSQSVFRDWVYSNHSNYQKIH